MQIEQKRGQIAELLSLGQLHEDQMQYDVALHYFLLAYEMMRAEVSLAATTAELAYNIGLLYFLLNDLDSAEQILRLALLTQMKTPTTSKFDLNETKNALAQLYLEKEKRGSLLPFPNCSLMQGTVSYSAC